jgi:hypothetical protein
MGPVGRYTQFAVRPGRASRQIAGDNIPPAVQDRVVNDEEVRTPVNRPACGNTGKLHSGLRRKRVDIRTNVGTPSISTDRLLEFVVGLSLFPAKRPEGISTIIEIPALVWGSWLVIQMGTVPFAPSWAYNIQLC